MWPDVRREDGEPRMVAIGYVGLRLDYMAFVDRADVRRIISPRKANQREVVERFRASGDGWQTRVDAALKEWLQTHSPG